MGEAGGGWFDAFQKKAGELGAKGAERIQRQLKKEVEELKQAGRTIKSAASDLGQVARGERELSAFVTTYRPKLQGAFRRELGPRWCRLIYDDQAIVPALNTAYGRIPPPLPWFVKQDAFVGFCMTHRDSLLGERALRVEELRALTQRLSQAPEERQALAARFASALGVAPSDPRLATEVDFAARYAASVPDLLGATGAAASGSQRFDALFPVLQELEYHYLDAGDEAPTTLPALLETAYLALALLQTLNDQSVAQGLPPLIDVDLRPANARIARDLGQPAAAAAGEKVEAIVKEAELMTRVGKVVGKAIPVVAVAGMIASVAAAGSGGGGGGGYDGGGGGGPSLHDRALSDAYTGALFGSECVARF